VTLVRSMTAEKSAVQGGKQKPKNFWKLDSTVDILKQVGLGEITADEAAILLETTAPTVKYYAKRRKTS